jgi:KDEL-tailed cysteine endopeptidase
VGDDFWLYKEGIFTGESCGYWVNHAMVAVGYGESDEGVEYAILRNSWGLDWGDEGYVKVELQDTQNGVCELYTDNTFTLVGF